MKYLFENCRLCQSISNCVCWSVCWSVGPSVTYLLLRHLASSYFITTPAQLHVTDAVMYMATLALLPSGLLPRILYRFAHLTLSIELLSLTNPV